MSMQGCASTQSYRVLANRIVEISKVIDPSTARDPARVAK